MYSNILREKLFSVCTRFATLASAIVSYLDSAESYVFGHGTSRRIYWLLPMPRLVFTTSGVPAIWREVSKQFMREKVLRAGFACNCCGLNNTSSDICIDDSSFATYSCKSQPNVLSVWTFEGLVLVSLLRSNVASVYPVATMGDQMIRG